MKNVHLATFKYIQEERERKKYLYIYPSGIAHICRSYIYTRNSKYVHIQRSNHYQYIYIYFIWFCWELSTKDSKDLETDRQTERERERCSEKMGTWMQWPRCLLKIRETRNTTLSSRVQPLPTSSRALHVPLSLSLYIYIYNII